MSITSSQQQQLYTDFADLLAHHPGLATWLSDQLQSAREPRAEELLSHFLAECAELGIPASAYPFTAQDRALSALESYMQAAQAELEAFMNAPTPRRADLAAAQDSEISEMKTATVPAVDPQTARAEITEQETASMPAPVPQDTQAGESETDKAKKQAKMVTPPGTREPSRPRKKHTRRPRTRRQRILYRLLLLLILATILIPAVFLINFGISAYTTYRTLSGQAHNAVDQLLDVKTVFSSGGSGKSHLNSIFDSARLQRAQRDFMAAGRDFEQLQNQLQQSDTLKTVAAYFPQYRTTLSSA